jgi:hypothetical protein
MRIVIYSLRESADCPSPCIYDGSAGSTGCMQWMQGSGQSRDTDVYRLSAALHPRRLCRLYGLHARYVATTISSRRPVQVICNPKAGSGRPCSPAAAALPADAQENFCRESSSRVLQPAARLLLRVYPAPPLPVVRLAPGRRSGVCSPPLRPPVCGARIAATARARIHVDRTVRKTSATARPPVARATMAAAATRRLVAQPKERRLAIRGGLQLGARIWGDEEAAGPAEVVWPRRAQLLPLRHWC